MPYISNAFVSEALDCARRGGVNVAGVLREAGIDAPGGGGVAPEQFGLLWLAIADAMNDEFFGNAARPMRPGSFTLMCHAVRDAPNVEISLRRALRFLRIAIDEPYGTLTTEGGIAQITLHDSRRDRSAFAYRTFWVILHGLTCWLAKTRIQPMALTLTCPAPRAAEDYRDFFGAPVQFDAQVGAMRYDARPLAKPVRRTEDQLKDFLRAAPGIFLSPYKPDEGALALVTGALKAADPTAWPDMPQMAKQVGLSQATLRRNLAAQGTSFRRLVAERRMQLAKDALRTSEVPVTDLAYRLGYAEPSAFFRAFKEWTGQSPDAWRTGQTKTPGSPAGRIT